MFRLTIHLLIIMYELFNVSRALKLLHYELTTNIEPSLLVPVDAWTNSTAGLVVLATCGERVVTLENPPSAGGALVVEEDAVQEAVEEPKDPCPRGKIWTRSLILTSAVANTQVEEEE